MDFKGILSYQELDSELFKIEKQLRENINKKNANIMRENMKNAQARSIKLEEKASELLNDIDKVKKQFKIQQDKIEQLLEKDINALDKEEIEKLMSLKDKLSQNLNILDKNLSSLAENMNLVLSDFNKTIKTFNSAKEQYAKFKESYDNDVKSVEERKAKIEDELKNLAKKIEPKLIEAYEKRRKENIFPVFVELKGHSCGGCHMELPYANISKLESDGILSCEHCHRVIYKKI